MMTDMATTRTASATAAAVMVVVAVVAVQLRGKHGASILRKFRRRRQQQQQQAEEKEKVEEEEEAAAMAQATGVTRRSQRLWRKRSRTVTRSSGTSFIQTPSAIRGAECRARQKKGDQIQKLLRMARILSRHHGK
jgi:flagellar biosynthesis/type III secretory pathway M-ring protein FliF/YscJ